LDLQP